MQAESCEGAYNVVSPIKITHAEVMQAFAHALRRPYFLKLPAWWVRLLFGEMGESLLLQGQDISSEKLQKSGYVFQYHCIDQAMQAIHGA